MAARTSPVPDWVPDDLPRSPGVYHFVDALGTPIYIGKSVNLRRRVRGYFYGGGPKVTRLRDMLRLAHGVAAFRTGTDLEACLEEADGIATHRPAFNRVGKNRSRGWYVEIDWSVPFPRFRIVRRTRRVRAQYIGPFRGRRIPEDAVKLVEKIYRLRTCPGAIRPDADASPCLQHGIDQCSAPCVGLVGLNGYRKQVGRAVQALLSEEVAAEDARRIRVLLSRTGGGAGWDAVGLRRRLHWFSELDSYRPGLRRPAVDHSQLIVLPAAEPKRRVLVPVARGRVLALSTIDPDRPDWTDRLEDVCYRIRLEELRAESAFPVSELTLTLIVSAWVRDGAKHGQVFDLEQMSAGDVVEALRAAGMGAVDRIASGPPADR